jgi:uncharacterized protein YhaN
VFGERPRAEGDSESAARMDRALLAADQLADERQVETQRLAELAQTERDLADLSVRIEAARKRLNEAQARRSAVMRDWAALWSASGLALAADDRALAFLREVEVIRAARDTLRHDVAQLEGQRESVAFERSDVERLRGELGLPAMGDEPLRMADLREAVAAAATRFLAARDHERDLRQLEQGQADLIVREQADAADRAALAAEAAEIFPRLAIRPSASAGEARAAIEQWRAALAVSTQLEMADRRIAGIERDRDQFIGRVSGLLRELGAPDAADAFAAAKTLRGRLDRAGQARSRADAALEAVETRERGRVDAEAKLRAAEAAMAELLATAGCQDEAALAPLLDRLDAAGQCTTRLTEARERFAALSGGLGEDDIRAAIDGRDDEALALAAAERQAAHGSARAACDAAIEADTQARAALAELDRRDGAALAAQDEQDAVAEIAEAVERFSLDHVAARLLSAAIERYRAEHQSPIVDRASHAFGTLTGGRWSGIGIDYDQETPRLAAIRDGNLLGPDALSEGTRDQLFLALRVAAIEEHARRATPLPFIADDLFITFDELRTENGFRLLGELGAHTQVIVFTHHLHVAESATAVLGSQAAVIEL